MKGFKAWLTGFFSGRYGMDQFGCFLLIIYAVLCIFNAIFRFAVGQLFATVIAVYLLWRTMSRNYFKRRAENMKYLNIQFAIRTNIKLFFDRIKYIKTARFRKCKHCKAIIKLPNKRGKHTVRCPKCSELFDVNLL